MYNQIISSSFIALSLAAQGGGIFYQLTSAHGLSSDRTRAVIRDREGFYRIATQDGLNGSMALRAKFIVITGMIQTLFHTI